MISQVCTGQDTSVQGQAMMPTHTFDIFLIISGGLANNMALQTSTDICRAVYTSHP